MINREKYPPIVWETIATHSFFIDLGYLSEEIFVAINASSVIVELKAEGKVLPIRIGTHNVDPQGLQRKFIELSREWNQGGTITQAEKDEIFHNSQAYYQRLRIMAAIMAMGFTRWIAAENRRSST